MRRRLGALLIALAAALAGTAPAEDDAAGFVPLFDGHSLDGWSPEHTDRFRARDGVIVNHGGLGWLRYRKSFKDFEFRAEYRAMSRGADSGLFFRATPESSSGPPHWPARGYELQVIDARNNVAILGHGVAPPKSRRQADALREAMKGPGEWQTIALKIVGNHAEASLNGRTITVSDSIERPEGCIGLQGENGHFEWRNLMIKELPAP
jgi:hypothetical protein